MSCVGSGSDHSKVRLGTARGSWSLVKLLAAVGHWSNCSRQLVTLRRYRLPGPNSAAAAGSDSAPCRVGPKLEPHRAQICTGSAARIVHGRPSVARRVSSSRLQSSAASRPRHHASPAAQAGAPRRAWTKPSRARPEQRAQPARFEPPSQGMARGPAPAAPLGATRTDSDWDARAGSRQRDNAVRIRARRFRAARRSRTSPARRRCRRVRLGSCAEWRRSKQAGMSAIRVKRALTAAGGASRGRRRRGRGARRGCGSGGRGGRGPRGRCPWRRGCARGSRARACA
jgi:hypothetical protein